MLSGRLHGCQRPSRRTRIPQRAEVPSGNAEQTRLAPLGALSHARKIIRHAVLVVSQTKIQRKIFRNLPIVLEETRPVVLTICADDENRVAVIQKIGLVRRVCKELFADVSYRPSKVGEKILGRCDLVRAQPTKIGGVDIRNGHVANSQSGVWQRNGNTARVDLLRPATSEIETGLERMRPFYPTERIRELQ